MRDPYVRLLEHMQVQGGKNNTPYVQTGEVISTNPLTVMTGDLQLGVDNLLIADYLLPNYARKISIPITGGSGVMSSVTIGDFGSHTHNISGLGIADGGFSLTDDGLKVGDIVALTPTLDEQIYIILAKVVSLAVSL